MPKTKLSLATFQKHYGTHEQCLQAIKHMRFPDPHPCSKCNKAQKFYPVRGRTAYACNNCGHHIYPLAGTIFENSTTPLNQWFFAMYIMAQTRSGTSAKQLERILGVTYKTAWRMFKQIRILMSNEDVLLDGIVEIDEAFMGGHGKNRAKKSYENKKKEVLLGMIQRGGTIYVKHVPNTKRLTLVSQITEHIDPNAHVMTDQHTAYAYLKDAGYYKHFTVSHVDGQYVRNRLFHINSIEGFWGNMKRGLYGVYRQVSTKYLQAYVDEYAFRHTHRKHGEQMFAILLERVTLVTPLKVEKLVSRAKENPF
jgi:transposase-like protein